MGYYSKVIIVTFLLSLKLGNAIQYDPEITPLVHGDFPWVLKLINHLNGDKARSCGASLISNEFALTAAHCVNDNNITSQ